MQNTNGSILDEIVWNEFHNDKNKLQNLARSIMLSVSYEKQSSVQPINTKEEEFPEGKILYRVHKSRERNSDVVKMKKQKQWKTMNFIA